MKSLPDCGNDAASEDDIFGPPRTYSSSYYHTSSTRPRPSMISAKYRQKEERRKVLKISVNKLKKIEDPEASLCRSVLINNTMKRLQKEAKDDKQPQKSIITDFTTLIDSDDLVAAELSSVVHTTTDVTTTYGSRKRPADDLNDLVNTTELTYSSRKRTVDEVEDCDVQDVLSQFYMPPTPRMLTSIDEDEEEVRPEPKRLRYEERPAPLINEPDQQQLRHQAPVTTASSFSCGHASMFNELQNNVFHSLVASLET